MQVPEALIRHPESITLANIHAERDVELRRVMLERYGFDRFVTESGAIPIHADETGTLYRIALPDDEPLTLVRVTNATAEPDRPRRQYVLRVPPTITPARAAVAWSFKLAPDAYRPTVET